MYASNEESPLGRVEEVAISRPPALVVPDWEAAMPWVVQGTTLRGGGTGSVDYGLYAKGSPDGVVRARLGSLAATCGASSVVIARQVHGAGVGVVRGATGSGVVEVGERDGHVTDRSGVLLLVTAADCVPVFLVDPRRRAIGLLHAGWRGVSAGVLEAGIDRLAEVYGSPAAELRVHLGPSMCARCYEVGPEVFEAVGRPLPDGPTPIGLREVLAERAVERGVGSEAVTISTHCTRCTGSDLFSHRAGDAGRHVGFLGIRP